MCRISEKPTFVRKQGSVEVMGILKMGYKNLFVRVPETEPQQP